MHAYKARLSSDMLKNIESSEYVFDPEPRRPDGPSKISRPNPPLAQQLIGAVRGRRAALDDEGREWINKELKRFRKWMKAHENNKT